LPPLHAHQHLSVLAHFSGESSHEAYLPTKQSSSSAHPRLPCPHGHQSRPSCHRPPSRERSQASHGLSGARALVRRSTCQLRSDRSNQRSDSGTNPNSTGSTRIRAAPLTPASRSSFETAAVRFPGLDYRLPHASSVTPCGVTASNVWFGNRSVSISMNCPQWTSSSMHAQALGMRKTPSSPAAWKSTGARW